MSVRFHPQTTRRWNWISSLGLTGSLLLTGLGVFFTSDFAEGGSLDGTIRRWIVPLVLLAGVGISFLLFALIRVQTRLSKDLECRVEQRTADLKESNEQMEAFTYTVAHDLRAPLRAMQGFSQALLEDYSEELSGDAQEYIRRIISSAQRMDHLIQDLLTYSRLSRTQITLDRTSVDQVVDNVVLVFEAEIKSKNAVISIERPMPKVIAHAGTLEHIFANLLGNALKFVSDGVTPQVSIRSDDRGSVIRIWIEDNGIGVAPQYQDRIFRVFERLHGPETYPGTGIGLAIVRKGLERMHGRIGVESAPGAGSRFWFELPKAPAE